MPNLNENPIQSVGGVTVPVPSKYDWQLSDVSSKDAGRTEDGLMHKEKIAQNGKNGQSPKDMCMVVNDVTDEEAEICLKFGGIRKPKTLKQMAHSILGHLSRPKLMKM